MTLDEARVSAKEGIISRLNAYATETIPASALLHAVVWRLNAVIDGAAPTTGSEAMLDAMFNFVVALQDAARPFFPQIDAATTIEDVWAVAGAFDPVVVPPPALAVGAAFYATKLETIPE